MQTRRRQRLTQGGDYPHLRAVLSCARCSQDYLLLCVLCTFSLSMEVRPTLTSPGVALVQLARPNVFWPSFEKIERASERAHDQRVFPWIFLPCINVLQPGHLVFLCSDTAGHKAI
jgi:hypothetical protein